MYKYVYIKNAKAEQRGTELVLIIDTHGTNYI